VKLAIYKGKTKEIVECDGVVINDDLGHPIAAAIQERSQVIFCAIPNEKEFPMILERLGETINFKYQIVSDEQLHNRGAHFII